MVDIVPTGVPIGPIVQFIKSSLDQTSATLERIEYALHVDKQSDLAGSLRSLDQAIRLGDTERIRYILPTFDTLSDYFGTMTNRHVEQLTRPKGFKDRYIRRPLGTLLGELGGTRAYSDSEIALNLAIQAMTSLRYQRLAEIGKLICHRGLQYPRDLLLHEEQDALYRMRRDDLRIPSSNFGTRAHTDFPFILVPKLVRFVYGGPEGMPDWAMPPLVQLLEQLLADEYSYRPVRFTWKSIPTTSSLFPKWEKAFRETWNGNFGSAVAWDQLRAFERDAPYVAHIVKALPTCAPSTEVAAREIYFRHLQLEHLLRSARSADELLELVDRAAISTIGAVAMVGKPAIPFNRWESQIADTYRGRTKNQVAIEATMALCHDMIDHAAEHMMAFEFQQASTNALGSVELPKHKGYQQLVILLDKQGRHQEAIDYCQKAAKEGWEGDWEKRIARYQARLSKKRKV